MLLEHFFQLLSSFSSVVKKVRISRTFIYEVPLMLDWVDSDLLKYDLFSQLTPMEFLHMGLSMGYRVIGHWEKIALDLVPQSL